MGLTLRLGWGWRWNLRPASRDALCCRIHTHPGVKPHCILNKWAVLIGGGE